MFGKQAARYDLRLDSSCFFTSTNQSASSTCPITGRFCVTFPQAVWVNRIKLILIRVLKIPVEGTITTKDREHYTHVQELELASSKTHRPFTLPAGDYDFPFEIPLREILLETVTGPGHNYRTYRIDAIVERTYWKDTIVSQPLRIYNAPDIEWNDTNTWYPLTVEGQSDQNILHCTSIPSSYIPFGSTFSVACGFQVPSKNVKLRTVTIEVIEKHKLHLDATAAEAALGILHITSAKDLTIFRERLEPAPESGLVSCTGTEWCINTRASLPVSFDLCSQNVVTRTVKIMHALVITSEFEHENGQLFDTVATTIPLSIYMDPRNIGPDGAIYSRVIEHNPCPPPPYDKHTFSTMIMESTVQECLGQAQAQTRALEPEPYYDLAARCAPPVYSFLLEDRLSNALC